MKYTSKFQGQIKVHLFRSVVVHVLLLIFTTRSVQHGGGSGNGGSVLVSVCFDASGPGRRAIIDRPMNSDRILQ